MRYTTTNVSRRMMTIKVKSPPGPRKSSPAAARSVRTSATVNRFERADVVPLLFDRTAAWQAPAAPARKNWMAASLLVVASAALLVAIATLLWGRRWIDDPGTVRTARPPSGANGLTGPNLRAMKYSVASNGKAGEAASGAAAVPSQPHLASSAGRDGRADDAGRIDENDPAILDGRKLVLPPDVSGNCEIGEGGLRDLGACLARNGARSP